jgi:Tfp pilus assembly protein PilX
MNAYKYPKFPVCGSYYHASGGAALVASLVFLTVLSLLGASASKSSIVQERMASNYRFSVEALNHAETGIADALTNINENTLHLDGYGNELDPNDDGVLNDRFSLTYNDVDTGVNYRVVMVDDDDGDADFSSDTNGIVLLLAQGTAANGSVRTVEVAIDRPVVSSDPFELDKAVLAEESIEVGGNTTMSGTLQDIHSNQDIDLTGNSIYSEGTISAAGTVTGSIGDGGGETTSGAESVYIPEIDPKDFEEYADYIFESDGLIYASDGTLLGDGNDSSGYKGFKFNGDKWSTLGNSPGLEGDLYFKGVHGNIDVGSNPGAKGNPWTVSLFAEGYIDLNGTPVIANYKDPSDPEVVQNLLFVAGTDVKILGSYEQPEITLQGIIAAREQFDIKGNASIKGALISQGAASTDSKATGNFISGSATITFDGLDTPWVGPPPSDAAAVVLYWRQLKIAEGEGEFAI